VAHSLSHSQATDGAAADPHSREAIECYHCGLPLPRSGAVTSRLAGEERVFCCVGCEAVAHAITDRGLQDYYRFREALPARGDPQDADRFRTYDDPAAQASFVHRGEGDEREAALLLEGVRCAACVWLSEQSIQRVPGVLSAQVNYATHRARVRWDASRTRLSEILAAVAAVGYRAHPHDARHLDAVQAAERRSGLWRLLIAGLGMAQVMMYAIPAYIADAESLPADIAQLMRWASFFLTLPVVIYSAQPFFQGAWRDLRRARLGMDVPVALGVGVAFLASVWATLRGAGEVYFDSVTMFVFLLLLGRYLELVARQRAVGALTHLGKLVPEHCARVDGYPESLDVETVVVGTLRAGDVVLVKPGEPIPADGAVLEGESLVSESLMTGENRPVRKARASVVMGGSVNVSGALVVRVERVGADSVLGTIARLAERAAAEKPRTVELADQAAHWFVLTVLVVAGLTGAWWFVNEPERVLWVTVSVLIVTCPCALSLATPVALTAATGALARRGFVATRGHTIEALAVATDFVFDKTGTLTRGALQVTGLKRLGDVDDSGCLALAAGLEQASEHPHATAVRAYATEAGIRGVHFALPSNRPGAGVEGALQGARYRIGSQRFCAEIAGDFAASEPSSGASAVYLVRDGEWLARLTLRDSVRPEARALVHALKSAGKEVHLLSGDAADAVVAVGHELGIAHVRGDASPDDKRAYVKALQSSGRVVAMVGDGVNDAPVLAQADISIAMAAGAHLAQVKADAVLLSNAPADLTHAIGHARKTRRIIGQNIAWAIAYNAIAVPAAVAGFVTPWLAGIGMAGSSLVVVLNAGRLAGRAQAGSRPEVEARELETA